MTTNANEQELGINFTGKVDPSIASAAAAIRKALQSISESTNSLAQQLLGSTKVVQTYGSVFEQLNSKIGAAGVQPKVLTTVMKELGDTFGRGSKDVSKWGGALNNYLDVLIKNRIETEKYKSTLTELIDKKQLQGKTEAANLLIQKKQEINYRGLASAAKILGEVQSRMTVSNTGEGEKLQLWSQKERAKNTQDQAKWNSILTSTSEKLIGADRRWLDQAANLNEARKNGIITTEELGKSMRGVVSAYQTNVSEQGKLQKSFGSLSEATNFYQKQALNVINAHKTGGASYEAANNKIKNLAQTYNKARDDAYAMNKSIDANTISLQKAQAVAYEYNKKLDTKTMNKYHDDALKMNDAINKGAMSLQKAEAVAYEYNKKLDNKSMAGYEIDAKKMNDAIKANVISWQKAEVMAHQYNTTLENRKMAGYEIDAKKMNDAINKGAMSLQKAEAVAYQYNQQLSKRQFNKTYDDAHKMNKAIDDGIISWQKAEVMAYNYAKALSAKEMKVVRAEADKMRIAIDRGKLSVQGAIDMQKRYEGQLDPNSIVAQAQATKKLNAEMAAAAKNSGFFGITMTSLLGTMKQMAQYMISGAMIGAIVAPFAVGLKAIVEYDQALQNLKAITGANDTQTRLMGEAIKGVVGSSKFSLKEVSDAMTLLGQAGFTASEAINSIQGIANLATGTLSSMAQTADLVTTAIRAFELTSSDTNDITDIFAAAVNKSKLNMQDLNIAFNYLAPVAHKANLSLAQSAAAAGVLADHGLRASTIGTGLRQVLSHLIDPTDKMNAIFRASGANLEKLNPLTNDFGTVLEELSKVVITSKDAFELFGQRGAPAILALTTNGAKGFKEMSKQILASGQASRMAEIQMSGLQSIIHNIQNKFELLTVQVGEGGLTGVFKALLKAIQIPLMLLVNFANTGFGKFVISTTLLAGAFWMIPPALISIVNGVKLACTSLIAYTAMTAKAGTTSLITATGINTLTAAMAANPITAAMIVLGLAAVTTGLYQWITASERATSTTEENKAASIDRANSLKEESTKLTEFSTQLDKVDKVMKDHNSTQIEINDAADTHSSIINQLVSKYPQWTNEIIDAKNSISGLKTVLEAVNKELAAKQVFELTNSFSMAAESIKKSEDAIDAVGKKLGVAGDKYNKFNEVVKRGAATPGLTKQMDVISNEINKFQSDIFLSGKELDSSVSSMVSTMLRLREVGGSEFDKFDPFENILKAKGAPAQYIEMAGKAYTNAVNEAKKKEAEESDPNREAKRGAVAIESNKKLLQTIYTEKGKVQSEQSIWWQAFLHADLAGQADIIDARIKFENTIKEIDEKVKNRTYTPEQGVAQKAQESQKLIDSTLKAKEKGIDASNKLDERQAAHDTAMLLDKKARAENDFKRDIQFAETTKKEREKLADGDNDKLLAAENEYNQNVINANKHKNEVLAGIDAHAAKMSEQESIKFRDAEQAAAEKYAQLEISNATKGRDRIVATYEKKLIVIKGLQDQYNDLVKKGSTKEAEQQLNILNAQKGAAGKMQADIKTYNDNIAAIEQKKRDQQQKAQEAHERRTMSISVQYANLRESLSSTSEGKIEEGYKANLERIDQMRQKALQNMKESGDTEADIANTTIEAQKLAADLRNKEMVDLAYKRNEALIDAQVNNLKVQEQIDLRYASESADSKIQLRQKQLQADVDQAKSRFDLVKKSNADMKNSAQLNSDQILELDNKQTVAQLTLEKAKTDQIRYEVERRNAIEVTYLNDRIADVEQFGTEYMQIMRRLYEMDKISKEELNKATTISGGSWWDNFIYGATKGQGALYSFQEEVVKFGTGFRNMIGDGVTNSLMEIQDQTKTAKEAFKEMARSIVLDIEKMIIKMLVMKAINGAMGFFSGGMTASTSTPGFNNPAQNASQGWRVQHSGQQSGGVFRQISSDILGGLARVKHSGLSSDERLTILRKNENVLTPSQMNQRGSTGTSIINQISVPVDHPKDQASAQMFGKTVARLLDEKINSMLVKNTLPGGLLYGR